MNPFFVRAAARAVLALIAAFVTLTASVHAASAPGVLTVESVLSPAWVERANGRREPLAVGMVLGNKEKVHTGDGGRALLRLADGSAFKLGDSALLGADELNHKQDAKGGVVSASLDVVRGAFRFTTGLLAKSEAQRNVRVKVNAVTAGIRGTDVWGKSDSDRDIVCLLEGRINVTHGAAQFTMQEPLSFYIAPRKGQAQPPSRVTADQVKQWQAETEIDARSGATRSGGTAAVTVSSAGDERTATALRDKLRDSGFPAEFERAVEGGAARYHVRILSLPDADEAGVLAQRLQRQGYKQARPGR
ncbi:MAG TPA: FecR domain-containing protein [Burkholderiales bacterium]|nr:FecR domain-containing protein [Burkholderiales bacterium]